jgi:hypothetical protein
MLDMDMGTDSLNLQPDGKGNFSARGDLSMGGNWQRVLRYAHQIWRGMKRRSSSSLLLEIQNSSYTTSLTKSSSVKR